MIVRVERPEDTPGIRAVHVASFPTPAEARLVDALREAGRLSISLIAELGAELVGHVGFSPVTLEDASGGMGLAPVAVLPEFRRRGVAARLVEEGLSLCRRRRVDWVVVLGDPAYYGRFGFREAARWNLRDPFEGGAAFQAMELRPGTIPVKGGLVRYAPEFEGV